MSRDILYGRELWQPTAGPEAVKISNTGDLAVRLAEEIIVLKPSFQNAVIHESSWVAITNQNPIATFSEESLTADPMHAWLAADKSASMLFRAVSWSSHSLRFGECPLLLAALDDGTFMIFEGNTNTTADATAQFIHRRYDLNCNGLRLLLTSDDFYANWASIQKDLGKSKIRDSSWLLSSCSGDQHLVIASEQIISIWCIGRDQLDNSSMVQCVTFSEKLLSGAADDCIVAITSMKEGDACHALYGVSSHGCIIKMRVDLSSKSIHIIYRVCQISSLHAPLSSISVLPSARGSVLAISFSGGVFTAYAENDFSGTRAGGISSIKPVVSPVSGANSIVSISRGVAKAQNPSESFDDAFAFGIVSLACGSIAYIKFSLRVDERNDSTHLTPLVASVVGGAVIDSGLPQRGLALDELECMMYHLHDINPIDLSKRSAQINRYLLKMHVGLSSVPFLGEELRWCHYSDKVVKIILDKILLSRKDYFGMHKSNNLIGFSMAFLYSALVGPPPSYLAEVLRKTSEMDEISSVTRAKRAVPRPTADTMEMSWDDDETAVKRKRLKAFKEPVADYFNVDSNIAVIEAVDIFIRSVFLCEDGLDDVHCSLNKEAASTRHTEVPREPTVDDMLVSACNSLVEQYDFARVNSYIKVMGGVEGLLATPLIDEEQMQNKFLRLLYLIEDPELLSMKVRLMQSAHCIVGHTYGIRSIPLGPNLSELMYHIRTFVKINYFVKSLLSLQTLLENSETARADWLLFPLDRGPFIVLKTPLLISSSCILNPLTLRELASAICIVRFLQRQLLFVKDNTATSLSFRPAMSSSVSNRIAEICVNVANTLKDQIIHKRADICVSCPICEAILLKLSADDLGPADVNDSTLENQETLQCKTCSIDIDICCFTLLPYVPCNLDTDAVPAVYPLKCTACRALCNSGRMQHWMPEHCRVEYSWLPQSSGANCFCMFCSVPLMPANC